MRSALGFLVLLVYFLALEGLCERGDTGVCDYLVMLRNIGSADEVTEHSERHSFQVISLAHLGAGHISRIARVYDLY